MITPTFPLIVECKEGDEFIYSIDDGEYNLKIIIPFMENGPKNGFVNSDLYKQLADRIEINITKEVEYIPEIPLTEEGGRDYTKVSSYFNDQKVGYSEIAIIYYKRLINYFKFKLSQPYLDSEYVNQDEFSNPVWSDSYGINYGTVGGIHHVQSIPGMSRTCLGIKTLKAENTSSVKSFLEEDYEAELYQQILSDAQAAILSGDLRRAIFEMAVVCELFTKRIYFSNNGVSGLAFDYFEDKGKVKITVIELITGVAAEVLGESFKVFSGIDYENIDFLFRCRNKVAHRGNVFFKNDMGKVIRPDQKLIENWYDSVGVLLEWLQSK